MSAREGLARLEDAVGKARERAGRLDAERLKARRAHTRALEPWRGYWHEVGAGAERDPEREAELEREVRDSRAAVAMRPVLTDGRMTDLAPVDERMEVEHEGALEALAAAEAERDNYLREHAGDLIGEAAPEVREALEACREALDRYGESVATYERGVREMIRYGEPSDAFPTPPEVPPEAAFAFRRAGVPAPLGPEGDE